jgi:hypothetical protein
MKHRKGHTFVVGRFYGGTIGQIAGQSRKREQRGAAAGPDAIPILHRDLPVVCPLGANHMQVEATDPTTHCSSLPRQSSATPHFASAIHDPYNP